jgi:hypothetical protein
LVAGIAGSVGGLAPGKGVVVGPERADGGAFSAPGAWAGGNTDSDPGAAGIAGVPGIEGVAGVEGAGEGGSSGGSTFSGIDDGAAGTFSAGDVVAGAAGVLPAGAFFAVLEGVAGEVDEAATAGRTASASTSSHARTNSIKRITTTPSCR